MNSRSSRRRPAAPLLAIIALFVPSAFAGRDAGGDAAVVRALPSAKHSMLEVVRRAAEAPAVAISAKFEDEGKGLVLSVYTAERGLEVDAEANTLRELIGDATAQEWRPSSETFEDALHVARASEQLTLMRTTKLTLADAIVKAGSLHGATVLSIAPAIRDGRGVFLVRVAVVGEVIPFALDLATGDPVGGRWPRTPLPPEPTPLVGMSLPEPVVGSGRWIGATPPPLAEVATRRVLLVASNSYLCEQTDEAYAWPRLAAWVDELGPQGVEAWSVVGAAESAEEVEAYVRAKRLRYPVLHDPTNLNAKAWDSGGTAMAFLLGRDGKVLWQGRIGPQGDPDGCEAAIRRELARRKAEGTVSPR
jgi:hypothetical protein